MEQIEYTRTVVPSSMRSSYWKYFGFPSDNGNNILTRQKIVCTLCNTAIAYNKNTSNLRTHLMAKHPDTFQKLLTNKRNSHDREELESDYKNILKIRRCDNDVSTFIDESTDVPISETRCEELTDQAVEKNDVVQYEECENVCQSVGQVIINQPEGNQYEDQQHQQSLEIMLADVVQNDLLSLCVIEGEGFRTFSQQISGISLDEGIHQRVTSKLKQRIADCKAETSKNVVQLSQISPYSLSIEWFADSDDMTVLNVYFNFLDQHQSHINSVLFHTTVVEGEIDLLCILKDVNIGNCKCIVVSNIENINKGIVDFAKCSGMDIIECLASTLERALRKIFQLPPVAQGFTELYGHIQDNYQALKPPCIKILCCWSKLSFLKFVFENTEGDDKCKSLSGMKAIYEYIKPLKMALDIISDERLPICTLSRPLVIKLFEQHFSELQTNDTLLKIQMVLEEELKYSIQQSFFLREATYFDARFRHEFSLPDVPFDLNALKESVLERFANVLNLSYIARPENTAATVAESTNAKKSNLKAFFDNAETGILKKNIAHAGKTNVDAEFELYHIGVALDLDQSPVKWWQEQAHTYEELSKIVYFYLTTPCCCVHRLYSTGHQRRWQILSRRKQLNHFCDVERYIWYLHFNEHK